MTWKIGIDLEHVSGEYFLARIDSLEAPESVFKTALPAEFKIGADGKPYAFGAFLNMVEKVPVQRTWFERL